MQTAVVVSGNVMTYMTVYTNTIYAGFPLRAPYAAEYLDLCLCTLSKQSLYGECNNSAKNCPYDSTNYINTIIV